MSQTQINTILRNLEHEYTSFLKEEINVLDFSFRNMNEPKGKELTESKKQGKQLVSLLRIYSQLKNLNTTKEILQKIIEVNRHSFNDGKKIQLEWSKQHDKQLELGSKYLKEKNKYMKLYS